MFILTLIGRESAVGIATRYKLDGPGIEFLWGQDLYTRAGGPSARPPPYIVVSRSLFVG